MLRTNGQVSHLTIGRKSQIAMTLALLSIGGWGVFASVSFVQHEKILTHKQNQIADARLAYRSLLSEIAAYQRKFANITRKLEENHSMMLGLVEQNAALQQNLKTVSSQLKNTETERESILAVREKLRDQLAGLEKEMFSLNSHNFNLKDDLESVEDNLQAALKERNDALFEGSVMRRTIKELEDHLKDLEVAETESVIQMTEHTANYNDTMLKVIDLAGLDVEQLLEANGTTPKGQGGPFIAAKKDSIVASKLKARLNELDLQLLHSQGLQDVMSRMPLTAPLSSYRITSKYGKRRDPMNKKWAAHYGVDLGSPFKSSVYAAAPGVVTYAGWKGKFGKFVEIDHGAGIKSRFGHLHKFFVKKGQQIKFREKVGLLGSTGRSTGAHLHYEILFNGRNVDPAKFFKAGRYVFQE